MIHSVFKGDKMFPPPDLPHSLDGRFDEMCEEFLDNIFEYESRVSRETWIKMTAKTS